MRAILIATILIVGCTTDLPDPVAREAEEARATAAVDYGECTQNLGDDLEACEAACEANHPFDPNPDPKTCDVYEGPSFLGRIVCITGCQTDYHRSWGECCRTGTVDGRPIDLDGTSAEAAACRAHECGGGIVGDFGLCLVTNPAFLGHELFGDPCKLDVFWLCNEIYNSQYDVCTPSWRSATCGSTACNVDLPASFDALITQLGDPKFRTREAAQAQLVAAIRALLANNANNRQCIINKVRKRFLEHPAISDPEVRARLGRIWETLIHEGGPGIPAVACAVAT